MSTELLSGGFATLAFLCFVIAAYKTWKAKDNEVEKYKALLYPKTVKLVAIPLEWISEPDNQQAVRQILSENHKKLQGNSVKEKP